MGKVKRSRGRHRFNHMAEVGYPQRAAEQEEGQASGAGEQPNSIWDKVHPANPCSVSRYIHAYIGAVVRFETGRAGDGLSDACSHRFRRETHPATDCIRSSQAAVVPAKRPRLECERGDSHGTEVCETLRRGTWQGYELPILLYHRKMCSYNPKISFCDHLVSEGIMAALGGHLREVSASTLVVF